MSYIDEVKNKREIKKVVQVQEKSHTEILAAITAQTKVLEQVRDLLNSPKEK